MDLISSAQQISSKQRLDFTVRSTISLTLAPLPLLCYTKPKAVMI
jgi:hypothetical protein